MDLAVVRFLSTKRPLSFCSFFIVDKEHNNLPLPLTSAQHIYHHGLPGLLFMIVTVIVANRLGRVLVFCVFCSKNAILKSIFDEI